MKRISMILLSALMVGVLSAQEQLALSLQGCVDMAMAKNVAYQMKQKEVQKAKAGVLEAYSTVLPQLNASASLQHAWAIQETTIPNFIKAMLAGSSLPGFDQMPDYVRLSFGLKNTLVYGATVTQPLFLGGAGVAGIKIGASAYHAAQQNLESAQQELVYQTAATFYGCILSQEVVKVREEMLQEAEKNLDVVKKKYEAGAASKFDLMRAEVNLANSRPDAITARNNYDNALTMLKLILALPMPTKIRLDGQLLYAEDEFAALSLENYQQMAQQNRPEIKALDHTKIIARQGIAIARSSFLPKVFFQSDYSYMGMRNDMKYVQDDFSKGFTSAVSVQMPLFNGFRTAKQYQKAQLDYRMALDTQKQASGGVSAEVEAAFHKLAEAREKYLSSNQTVELATESYRLAGMMYEEGANTQLDVFTAQLGLTSARMNYLSSLYEYQMARYALRKATGQLKDIL